MKLLTERTLIREVSDRWNKQYAGYRGPTPKHTEQMRSIGEKLAKLDGETATAADVAAIIGNDQWTRVDRCDECCAENIPVGVLLADTFDTDAYSDPRSATICLPCLQAAVKLAEEK